MNTSQAIEFINKHRALLVFPIDNKKEPLSLWSCFYPRTQMRWDWDETGDDRVVKMWHLKTELSTTRKVVYSKWYKGRATYFSRSLFAALLSSLGTPDQEKKSLNIYEKKLLRILEENSPLSTKILKKESGLRGKDQESLYHRSLKTLWEKCLIVGFGEVDDGAFPSLAIGATQLLYDDLWEEARKMGEQDSLSELGSLFESQPLYKKEWDRIKKSENLAGIKKKKGTVYGKDLILFSRT